MNKNLLTWRLSDNGHVHVADSAVHDERFPGEAGELTWYIGGGDDHWGVGLSGQQGQVWHQHVNGSLDEAKAVAEQYETEHFNESVSFTTIDVLERYYLVGGAFVTRRAATIATALHIGELNGGYAGPVQKRLRKARRDNKTLRIITEDGLAVIPANQITHVVVLQRISATQHEFVGEPGYPQHVYDGLADQDAGLVAQLMNLAGEYAEAKVDEASGLGGTPATKAAETAWEHLRTHITELVNDDLGHHH